MFWKVGLPWTNPLCQAQVPGTFIVVLLCFVFSPEDRTQSSYTPDKHSVTEPHPSRANPCSTVPLYQPLCFSPDSVSPERDLGPFHHYPEASKHLSPTEGEELTLGLQRVLLGNSLEQVTKTYVKLS